MALRAEFGSLLESHPPLVGCMAGDAVVAHRLQMHGMLSAFHGSLVATRARRLSFFFRFMNLVAVVALEGLMRPRSILRLSQRRFVIMTFDALFVAWNQFAGPEIMTSGACHVFFFGQHVLSMGVAIDAKLLLGIEFVQINGMTGGAFNIFFEPMQGMTLGTRNLNDPLVSGQVAGDAHGAGNNDLIVRSFGYLGRAFEYGANEHEVSFIKSRVVAGMAIDAFVNAGFPGMKRVFHQMAVDAEFGIVFGIVIQVEGTEPQNPDDQSCQSPYDDFINARPLRIGSHRVFQINY